MVSFDHDYVAEVIGRLGKLEPDATPAWGRLTADGMIAHLADAVRYSMGKGAQVKRLDNWFLRGIVAPLILNGLVRIPKNVKGPDFRHPDRAAGPPDDLDTLHAVLEEYLGLIQAGELQCEPHPAFGDLGIDGWAKMHMRHFEHHMRQFGV